MSAPYTGKKYELLEGLYSEFNRREYISPDPLEFLYLYDSPADREVVGLIASSLAYGRVASILASVRKVLGTLGKNPADTLACIGEDILLSRLSGFKHRFNDDAEMAKFLSGIGAALREYGSLENLFCAPYTSGKKLSALYAMDCFARTLLRFGGLDRSQLLPFASKGSACKRLALYIRWMARCDDVDPGGWSVIMPCDIVLPLDTHMFKIAAGLGFVRRKSADGIAVLEATEGFKALCPSDPVRYDFALTRFGIRTGMSVDELLAKFKGS
ncbi:MAG: TIGR02757 family protein [Synergistaceae bacterium]|nr:TIGR02757 family protein [Synergistaceae bacterium]